MVIGAEAHLCVHPLNGAIVGNDDVKGLVQDLDHHSSLTQLTKHLGEGWEEQEEVGGAR